MSRYLLNKNIIFARIEFGEENHKQKKILQKTKMPFSDNHRFHLCSILI